MHHVRTRTYQSLPDAKVILTTRDMDSWFVSVTGSIQNAQNSWLLTVIDWCHPYGRLDQLISYNCGTPSGVVVLRPMKRGFLWNVERESEEICEGEVVGDEY